MSDMTVHRLDLMDHDGLVSTRCGIVLNRKDTGLTFGGKPIETSFYDHRITCEFCLKPRKPRYVK